MPGVLKHIILDFCILKRYLQSVDFYFGAGCVVGQHLKERLFTQRVFFSPVQIKMSYCEAETVSFHQ